MGPALQWSLFPVVNQSGRVWIFSLICRAVECIDMMARPGDTRSGYSLARRCTARLALGGQNLPSDAVIEVPAVLGICTNMKRWLVEISIRAREFFQILYAS